MLQNIINFSKLQNNVYWYAETRSLEKLSRKSVLQKLFSVKRMLGNLNDFFTFIDWFHYTHKKIFDVHLTIVHALNCRTLKETRKVCSRVSGFHRLITSQHSTHTPRCSTLTSLFFRGPISRRPFFRGPIFRGPFFRGPFFQGTVFLGIFSRGPFFRGPFFRGFFFGDFVYFNKQWRFKTLPQTLLLSVRGVENLLEFTCTAYIKMFYIWQILSKLAFFSCVSALLINGSHGWVIHSPSSYFRDYRPARSQKPRRTRKRVIVIAGDIIVARCRTYRRTWRAAQTKGAYYELYLRDCWLACSTTIIDLVLRLVKL